MFITGEKAYTSEGTYLMIKVFKFEELSEEIQQSLIIDYLNQTNETNFEEADQLFKIMNSEWLQANEIKIWDTSLGRNGVIATNALYRSDNTMICPMSTTYSKFLDRYKEAYQIIVNENTSTQKMKKELGMNHYTKNGTLVIFQNEEIK